jgi:hypothetical protein
MKKKYMYDIMFFSFMLIFALAFLFTGKLLKVSNSFLMGLIVGILAGCIIIIAMIIKKRKSMKKMADEREQQLMMKSMSISHSLTVVVVGILCVISRSTTWIIPIALYDIFTMLLMFMVISYFLIYAFLSRKY